MWCIVEVGQVPIFCPACGAENQQDATRCVGCQESLLRDPIPIGKNFESVENTKKRSRRWWTISSGAMLLLVLAAGGYTYNRYHTAQLDISYAKRALKTGNYQSARTWAKDAVHSWSGANVKGIISEASNLAQSARYYHSALSAYNSGQYTTALGDFKRVAKGYSHYQSAQAYVGRISTGLSDLKRIKGVVSAIATVYNDIQTYNNDIQTYNNDYNTAVNYSNSALTEYQNGYYYGYSPSASFDNNVASGESALNNLQQDASLLATDSTALSSALGLVSATPSLSQATVDNIKTAAQALVNDASSLDTNMSSELTAFQNISNGSATQAYGVSSDIASSNQAEANMTTDQNNLSGSTGNFIGYTSGVIGKYLGISSSSVKANFKSIIAGN